MQRLLLLALTLLTANLARVAPAQTAGLARPSAAARILWHEDPRLAVEDARRSGQPILVYVGGSFCGYCRKMDRETWSDQRVISAVRRGFVPLHVDAALHPELVAQLRIQAYPTTILFGSDGRAIKGAPGYLPARDLLSLLNSAPKSVRPQ